MNYSEIIVDRRNDATWIGLNRPEVRNAFREQTLDEIAHALNETREDPTIVAVVVYGIGGHFSAGGDFHAMMKLNRDLDEKVAHTMLINDKEKSKLKAKGKLNTRARINSVVDDGSPFLELG